MKVDTREKRIEELREELNKLTREKQIEEETYDGKCWTPDEDQRLLQPRLR